MRQRLSGIGAMLLLFAGCSGDGPTGPAPGGGAPEALVARYEWVLEGWQDAEPVGYPSVQLSWSLPHGWTGLPFRIYARQSGGSGYHLISTVTSCSPEAVGLYDCTFTDRNVVPGERYEYRVRVVDERSDHEGPAASVLIDAPAFTPPPTPGAVEVTGLDGAAYLQWEGRAAVDDLWKYLVLWTSLDGEPLEPIYQVGETDGTGFLDERAENGYAYGYRIAAVDTFGHVSALSPVGAGIPRPDFSGELLYAMSVQPDSSGFRFVDGDALSPIVAGDSPDAQWRLEIADGAPNLVPRGETVVTSGVLTTALTCGPGSDPGCFAIDGADDPDAPRDYSTVPVALAPEMTYLLQVRGPDGGLRHAKVRPTVVGTDQNGRSLVIFGWAYQLIPGEPSLNRASR